jgi:hypothetical protein
MRTIVVVVIAVLGCSKKDTSPRGLCERGCKKTIGCLAAGNEAEIDNCIASCTSAGAANADQIEKIEAASCAELAAQFGGAGGTGGAAPAQPAAPAAGNGCTADCRGCVGDNSSCYAAAGGANGIPCDPCCCAPGGPSPTWKTPE